MLSKGARIDMHTMSYAVALLLIGTGFIIAEAFTPTYGALGFGGAIAAIAGVLILMDMGVGNLEIAWPIIGFLAALMLLFLVILMRAALRSRTVPNAAGVMTLVGAEGEMLETSGQSGWANIRGEIWKVRTAGQLTRGQRIHVVDVDGLVPRVAAAEGE